ncbi:MAG: serine hydroxymethyltransferase [Candidatus Sungbacteria bacterium]|nr:serine hydroxymethyltransferase [Candidatus Sungbacteria bacterium]
MQYKNVKKYDREIYNLIREEERRQKDGLELIPSESYASAAVLEALGSILNDKYAENYPGKRYYGGCETVDKVERLCQERALKVFRAQGYKVNVQPYSGSPANIEVYAGLLDFGDTIMALRLDHGGHLTHGSPVSFSGKAYKFIHYGVDPKTECLDYDEIARLAQKHKPKIILSGFTAYPRLIDFKKMHAIAKSVGAISMADISHISGLIIGGAHPSPFPFTDVVTTTTHKTLRGPRAAMIFSRKDKSIKIKDKNVLISEAIDKAVFPGMQGGPHEHTIAAIAVALHEAKKPEFRKFAEQVVKNAKVLAIAIQKEGLRLISGGTDNHLMLIDLRPFGPGRGKFIEKALEAVRISVNKSPIPNDPSPPFYPSGVRLGTPAITSRGMKEKEMRVIAGFIARVVREFSHVILPEEKSERATAVREFTQKLSRSQFVKKIGSEVKQFASRFPVPGIDTK